MTCNYFSIINLLPIINRHCFFLWLVLSIKLIALEIELRPLKKLVQHWKLIIVNWMNRSSVDSTFILFMVLIWTIYNNYHSKQKPRKTQKPTNCSCYFCCCCWRVSGQKDQEKSDSSTQLELTKSTTTTTTTTTTWRWWSSSSPSEQRTSKRVTESASQRLRVDLKSSLYLRLSVVNYLKQFVHCPSWNVSERGTKMTRGCPPLP